MRTEKNDKVGLGINDMPIWLLKKFKHDIKREYNDQHWVKLMDLMRKAEAYDAFVLNGFVQEQYEEENVEDHLPVVEDKEETPTISTFGKKIKVE